MKNQYHSTDALPCEGISASALNAASAPRRRIQFTIPFPPGAGFHQVLISR
ncbi:hypothetical protein P154DRAFT_69665 [Amniculicola lignicola CBS 123094]|uniref:Uncharacterized protein n=1 Tax=Amniculicola lignicola CBS 123094 TaxID=1392246 RepID=A0A6A5VVP9_9PLEO|nr:hypothetical protein P154DRAFT_69665 [Amniculicola lignicola CBS 123094]